MSINPKHFHNLITQMINHLHRNPSRFRLSITIMAQANGANKQYAPYHQQPAPFAPATMTPDLFLQAIHKHPDGITLSELLLIYPDVKQRTAQRWVSQWLKQSQITSQRQGRSIKYYPAGISTDHPAPADIPFSTDSQDIATYINRPLSAHTPVAYQ